MDGRGRNRVLAMAGAALLLSACGSSSSLTGGVTTSTPASTSFRTIPVTSTTSTLPPSTLGAAPAQPVAGEGVYVVQAGDAWPLIAKRVGVPYNDLLAYNGAQPDTPIYVGDKVRVPPAGSGTTTAPGSTTAPASTLAPEEGVILHTVEIGDSWIGVAKKYGADWKAVMEANGVTPELTSTAPLTVGSQIKVPVEG
jgi:LysM repeat protein